LKPSTEAPAHFSSNHAGRFSRIFSGRFMALSFELPQDVIPAFVWRESRRKFWMPAPGLKIAGTSFAGMTAENRTPICVVPH